LGDVALPDSDRAVQHDRLRAFEEPQGGEVPDRVDGELRGDGEVEVLQAGLLLEPGGPDPSGDRGRGPPVELVLAEDLQELLMAELAGAGLDEPDLQGVEHPGQLQGPQGALQLMDRGHDATSCAPNSASASGLGTRLRPAGPRR